MKTTTMCTTAGAACYGLAGVGAFVPPLPSSVAWNTITLRSPVSLGLDAQTNNRGKIGGVSRASFRPSESRAGRRGLGGATHGGEGGGGGDGVGGFYGRRGGVRRGAGPGKRLRATLLGSLDLKPGYRLFETVPPPATTEAARNSDSVTLDVLGKAPYGEDMRIEAPLGPSVLCCLCFIINNSPIGCTHVVGV